MRIVRVVLLVLALGSLLHPSVAKEVTVSRNPDPTLEMQYGFGISLVGTPRQIMRIKGWIDRIAEVPKGLDTLWAISATPHHLTIFHSQIAVISSGRTGAPLTDNLYNGVGENVEIKFNAEIPDHGSHWVFDKNHRRIEYTAIQNLYHELAHAMHMMTGTWRAGNSESAAIREENIFRRQLAFTEGRAFLPRYSLYGRPICGRSGLDGFNPYSGHDLICDRKW